MTGKRSVAWLLLLMVGWTTGCAQTRNTPPTAPPAAAPAALPASPPAQSTNTAPTGVKSLAELNDQSAWYIREERWAEAANAAKQAVTLDANSGTAWYNLGRAQLGAGNRADALQSFTAASRLTSGQNAEVEYFRSLAAAQVGQWDEARQILQQALKQWPDDGGLAYALAALDPTAPVPWVPYTHQAYSLLHPHDWQAEPSSAGLLIRNGTRVTVEVAAEAVTGELPRSGDELVARLRIARNQLVGTQPLRIPDIPTAFEVIYTVTRDSGEFTILASYLFAAGRQYTITCQARSPLFYNEGATVTDQCRRIVQSFRLAGTVPLESTGSMKPFGFGLLYPAGWHVGGSLQFDKLFIAPKGTGTEPQYPSIRLFTEVRDATKRTNMSPPFKVADVIGKGSWPYLTPVAGEATLVQTATGPVPGILWQGGGEAQGVRYKGLALEAHGWGHSYDLICTAPEAEWPQWEPVCQEVIRTFKGGDMSKVVKVSP